MQGAFVDFVVELLWGLIEMPTIFFEQVVAADPLTAIIWIIGAAITTFSIVAMAYLALGAIGIPLPHIGRGRAGRIE